MEIKHERSQEGSWGVEWRSKTGLPNVTLYRAEERYGGLAPAYVSFSSGKASAEELDAYIRFLSQVREELGRS